jgi:hypothetical protein
MILQILNYQILVMGEEVQMYQDWIHFLMKVLQKVEVVQSYWVVNQSPIEKED